MQDTVQFKFSASQNSVYIWSTTYVYTRMSTWNPYSNTV